MKLTREQVEEEFVTHFLDLREALEAEGERVDIHVEWQSFVLTKVNAKRLWPAAMHWVPPRVPHAAPLECS